MEVMYSFVACAFVRLFVCQQHNAKSYGQILIQFSGYVRNGLSENRLDFGGDPDHRLDPGIF